jgi:hypothetical protein
LPLCVAVQFDEVKVMHIRFIGHAPFRKVPRPGRTDDRDHAKGMSERAQRRREAALAQLRQHRRIIGAAGKA